jgi:hypothetical protein
MGAGKGKRGFLLGVAVFVWIPEVQGIGMFSFLVWELATWVSSVSENLLGCQDTIYVVLCRKVTFQ